jgi:hypothetical protein
MNVNPWTDALAWPAVVAPLMAATTALVVFYLKALRDHLSVRHADLARRLDRVEHALGELRRDVADIERDYTTKEEWLRECMWTRRLLDRTTRAVARLDAAATIVPPDSPADDGVALAPIGCQDNEDPNTRMSNHGQRT